MLSLVITSDLNKYMYLYTYHADTDEPLDIVELFDTKDEALAAMRKDINNIREDRIGSGASASDDPLVSLEQMPSPDDYKTPQEFSDAAKAYDDKYFHAHYIEDEDSFQYHDWDDSYFRMAVVEAVTWRTIIL